MASEKTVDGIITRLEQTKELCRQLNAFATNLCTDVDGVQIILAGDLNATPNEACVVHLRGRGMRNAYEDMSTALGHDEANRFTTWKTRTGVFKAGEVKHTIDYILYSAHRGSKVVSVAKLPNERDIPGDKGLPTLGFQRPSAAASGDRVSEIEKDDEVVIHQLGTGKSQYIDLNRAIA